VDSLVVGGAERVLQALLEDLPGHRIAPHLVCLRRPGPIGESLRAGGLAVAADLSSHRYDPRAFFRLLRVARAFRPQLFYLLDHSNALWHGRLVARLLGVPVCVAIHRTRRADGSRSLSAADRLLLPWTKLVFAVSEGHREYLASAEGLDTAKLVTIHNGVDPARYQPLSDATARAARRAQFGLPAEAVLAAQVAALRPEKDHALALRALASLAPAERPHLLLIGDGTERTRIQAQITELGLQEFVTLLGQRDDVPFLLAICDLLLLSSQARVETFPLCVLEAMAAALPVLATDVGSLREQVLEGETGSLVPPGQWGPFAQALRRLCQDAQLRRRMGEAGRDAADIKSA
jgi:glycosyltransferase involved in cell wall biosynthesis